MRKFRDWLRHKGIRIESFSDSTFNPSDKFKFNDDEAIAGDYEKDLRELIKVVMAKYQSEFTRWLAQIADERHDGEIHDLLRKVQTDRKSSTNWKSHRPSDKPEIVAPKADRANDPNGGDD